MKVVVVGGGFSGLAAAVALQEARHEVLLLERRGVLGGRAASTRDALTGEPVGGGTQVMTGAWRETLDLLHQAGLADHLTVQELQGWTLAHAGVTVSLVLAKDGMGGLLQGVADHFAGLGGVLRRRALAEAVAIAEGRVVGVRYVQRAETKPEIQAGKTSTVQSVAADAVVLAVPWSAVGRLLPEDLRGREPFAGLTQLEALPAVTVEMWVDRVVVHRPATSIRDGGVAWVIDRGRLCGREGAPQHLAVGLSPEWARESHANAEWVELARDALSRTFPAMTAARIERAIVLKEAEAAFAFDAVSRRLRPGPRTEIPNLFLAGDWTDTGLPASIEGAVRSGRAAARCLETRE